MVQGLEILSLHRGDHIELAPPVTEALPSVLPFPTRAAAQSIVLRSGPPADSVSVMRVSDRMQWDGLVLETKIPSKPLATDLPSFNQMCRDLCLTARIHLLSNLDYWEIVRPTPSTICVPVVLGGKRNSVLTSLRRGK
jgi:hypothetical protein